MILPRLRLAVPALFTCLVALAGCGGPEPGGDGGPRHDARADVHDGGPVGMDVATDRPAPTDVPQPDVVAPDAQPDGMPTDAPSMDGSIVCAESVECPMDQPFCDLATNRCVACLAVPSDTCPSGQYCDPTQHCTAGCRTDADCSASGSASHCDTARHVCVGCVGDGDCAPGTVCSMSACVPGCNAAHGCAVGGTCCTDTCEALDSDPMNCGACGHACAAGQTCCAGACADTTTDATNCGMCGHACSPAHARPVCAAGACVATGCDPGFANCDGDASNGCEVPTATDTTNCGACGHACPSGTNSMPTCAAGACGIVCTAGHADCDGMASNGCEVSTNTDTANCGACGHGCSGAANAAATCAMGLCGRRCNAGYGDCDGAPANGCETNLNTTPTACGACGMVCNAPNAVASCVGGACGIGSCIAGWGNCDGNASNGCETPTTTNTNCGTCGHSCGAGTVCSAGVCSSVCALPTSYCAGACVTFATDPMNCGSCGHACPTPPNASPRCTVGACGYTCNSGFGDCDGNAANGCETDLRTTLGSCGSCGHACPTPANGSAVCSGGACGLGACSPNFADCDNSAVDGCETDLRTSLANCGGCGNACSARANAAASCAGGACGLGACNAGFGNCDGNATNGCETNLNTSNANCGACGNACGPGTACSAGVCSSVCGAGLTYCPATGTCVNLQSDNANCGTCGHVCGSGTACMSGTCVVLAPPNDLCANATVIDMSQLSQTLSATTVNATSQLNAPCASGGLGGPDVFYRFTLAQPELVYADTVGAGWDTVMMFATSCTTPMPVSAASTGLIECDDDMGTGGCTSGGLQSQITAYLGAGTYYLVLEGYNGATGAASIHFQHLPTGNNGSTSGTPPTPRLLPAGSSTQTGTTAGTGLITAASEGLTTCYTNSGTAISPGGGGAEQSFFWRSCPEYTGGAFSATMCNATTTFDTYIYVANAAGTAGDDCDDDNSACSSNTLSSILPHPTGGTVSIPAGAGLHTFTVDAFSSGEGGAFSVAVTRP